MNKLLLIDGSSVLSKHFYATLPHAYKMAKTPEEKELHIQKAMKTSDGQYTNGVKGMMQFLLKVMKEQQPTHMVIAWDVSRDTFRRKLYPEYKGTRKETPKELREQFPLMQQLLHACGFYQGMVNGAFLEEFEADDVVGTFSKKFESEVATYIITGDQDALQLITDKTKVWLTTGKAKALYEKRNIDPAVLGIPYNTFEFTPQTFEEEYGLTPIQIIDKKALEGDPSDNIPGVKGVGPKASGPLLREYGTVEKLYEVLDNCDAKALKQLKAELKEKGITGMPFTKLMLVSEDEDELVGKKAAFLSKQLATIRTNIEDYQSISLDDVRLNIDKEAMKRKFEELEFKSLIEKI